MAHLVSQGDRPEEFTLSGEFDLSSATALGVALAGYSGVLELNASAVDFIDSSGMHGIVDAVGSRGAVFVRPSPAVERFLALLDQSGQRWGVACR